MFREMEQMQLSEFEGLYERIIPADHLLRRLKELVDFSFVHEALRDRYCPDNGRDPLPPVRMFKYLLLKVIYNLSDGDLVKRSLYDMSFKYFLDLRPEDGVMRSNNLTNFRRMRIRDMEMMDLLIGKSVEIAIEKGVLKSRHIIVDATHTQARYNQKSQYERLLEVAKQLRKQVYGVDEKRKAQMPPKVNNGMLEDAMEYCGKLVGLISGDEALMSYPKVSEKANLLKEMLEDNQERMKQSADEDARTGHKTADTSFYGYKTHIAMSDERIITAAVVTSGEKNDAKELGKLVEKSRKNGMEVEAVVGDMAYATPENLKLSKENFELVSKLNPVITEGTRAKEEEFEFNKDAGMYVCKAGEMAVKKYSRYKGAEGRNQVDTYHFDVEKCMRCPRREGCYKEGAKSKSYSVTIRQGLHKEQMEFQETEHFKELYGTRYKIEAKNGELKSRHGYGVASYSGLFGMGLQGATTIFIVNLKRIIKLIDEKKGETGTEQGKNQRKNGLSVMIYKIIQIGHRKNRDFLSGLAIVEVFSPFGIGALSPEVVAIACMPGFSS